MIEEARPGFLVDRRVLDRRVGEDQSVRVDPVGRVERQVGREVGIAVAVLLVEEAAWAVLGRGGRRPGAGKPQQAAKVSDNRVRNFSITAPPLAYVSPRVVPPGADERMIYYIYM